MERKYLVSEIDELRRLMENKYLYGAYNPQFSRNYGMSRTFHESDKVKAVEEMTRTAMLAGHTAADYRS